MTKKLIKFPILKRLIPSFYKKYLFFKKDYFKELIIEDVTYNLDLRHLIDRRFYFHKEYEEELFKPIVNIIKENNIDHFLDVGSCWGIYSLRLCKVFKNLNILAFDPIKKNIQRLEKSIFKNKINNIKVFHTALGSKKGNIELGATEDYSPNYKIDENNSVISEYSSIDTLDNLLPVQNKKLVIKIDTEGFEYEVLKGADSLLKNNKCYCQIEIIPSNKSDIFLYLRERNYKLISTNTNNKTDYIFSNFITKKIYL